MSAAAFGVHAAGTVPVMEQHVTEDTAYLYLKYAGDTQGAQAQVGTEEAEGLSFTDGQSVPVVTWLLLDNSVSISDADREKAKELMTNLVAGRASNESFTLCTYNEHLNILLQDSRSYADLKGQIDAITHNDQVSYLTDVLAELLDIESAREEPAYVRVVVICDGVDNNPQGLTREELDARLSEQSIPVYTLGCETGDNAPLLKELYAISRNTGACSWSLSGLSDSLEVVKAMSGEELPICAAVSIPEQMRDGSVKGIRVTFADGGTAQTQASMPFSALGESSLPETSSETLSEPAPEAVSQAAPEESSAESVPDSGEAPSQAEQPAQPAGQDLLSAGLLTIVIPAAAGTIVLILVIVLLLKRKKNNRIEVVEPEPIPAREKTFPLPQGSGRGDTQPLVTEKGVPMLQLTDMASPEHHFEAGGVEKLTVGRDASNFVALDYDRSISSFHCEIFIENGTWKVRDLKSSNGTMVNGVRIEKETELANGSVLKLGRTELLVEIS